jgi:glycosyl transferase family 87
VRMRIHRWAIAGLITALCDLLLFNVYQVVLAFPHKLIESDFRIWYAAAELGRHSGWSSLYDAGLQRQAVTAVWPGSLYLPFANPPPAAWLVLPLTWLPFGAALLLWTLFSVAIVVALSQAFAPPGRWKRLAFALSALSFLPVFVMVEAAPLSPAVFAGVAGCVLLLRANKQVFAGLVLSLVLVKPNLAMLIPPALLVAGYVRAFAAWLAATAALVVASFVSIGPRGTEEFISMNVGYVADGYHLNYSLAALLGGPDQYLIAAAVIVVVALCAARICRNPDPGIPVAVGVLGSLLINHHLTPADFTLLLVPAWIGLTSRHPLEIRLVAVMLWIAGWTSSIGLAWPVTIAEAVFVMSAIVSRSSTFAPMMAPPRERSDLGPVRVLPAARV